MSPSRQEGPSGEEERRSRAIASALGEIRGLDLEEQARNGGFSCDNLDGDRQRISIPSFAHSLEIIMPEGEMKIPAGLDSLSLRILALRYIKLSRGVPVSGEWIAYRDLPGGRFYAATIAPTIEKPLAEAYERDREALGKAARELGGEEASFGDESFIFHPFPRTPLLLILHRGGEEFASDSRVLFDRCCSYYFNTDDLKILATQLAAYLLKRVGAEEQAENLLWMVE